MRMITEATFNEPEEAEPLLKRLAAAGIRVELQDERKRQRFLFMSQPMAGVHLRVDRNQWEVADQLLKQWDASEAVLQAAIRCPGCGSSRVEFPQVTRKFTSPTLFAVLCALHLFERRFYCEECHLTWPLSEKLPARTDLLGWPIRDHPKAGSD
jgi:hypothetical protein